MSLNLIKDKRLLVFGVFLFLGLIPFSCQSPREESKQLSPKRKIPNVQSVDKNGFISVEQFMSQRTKGKYILVEVSKWTEYEKGHLPKAQHCWRGDFNSNDDSFPFKGMMGGRTKINGFLQNIGIHSLEQALYLYDTRGGCEAARVKWILERYGFDNAFILDGGKQAWQAAGYDLETTKKQKDPVIPKWKDESEEFSLKGNNLNQVAFMEEVIQAITDSNTVLVDTRSSAEFKGAPLKKNGKQLDFNPSGYAAGRIPGAVHFDWGNAVQLGKDYTLKSVKDLEFELSSKGITKDKNIITYCQSGTRSAHTALVLSELLDYPNVKNYDGSWIEWSYHCVNRKGINGKDNLEIEKD